MLFCVCVCVCLCVSVCVCVCVCVHRGRGALSEAGADDHRHLRGAAGGRHRVRGGLLQNQVCVFGNINESLFFKALLYSD